MATTPRGSAAANDIPGDDARSDATRIREDLAALKADVARLGETLAGLVASKASEAEAKARETVQAVEDRARAATDDVTQMVQRSPLTAIATAFGIGMLFGIWNRR